MEQIMGKINEIGTTKTLIICAIVFAIIIVLFLIYRSLRLKSLRGQIVEIENQMNAIKTLPLQYRLGRVQSISKNMPDVLELYEEYNAEYERIVDFQKNELALLVNDVDEQLFYGKMRRVGKKLQMLREMIDTYDHDSRALLEKIEKVTEIENVQRIEIIKVKEKYRHTIDRFENVRIHIEEYMPHILDFFNTLDDDFVKLEDMMNNQRFEDAQNFTNDIAKRVDWIDSYLEDLPSYVSVVKKYVPRKRQYIDELIERMQEHFSLDALHAHERYFEIKNLNEAVTTNIKSLELDDVASQLQSLIDLLDAFIHDLEEEMNAYEEFKEKWDDCYGYITQIYDGYKELMIDFNNLKSLYRLDDLDINIDETYQDFDVILRESYDLEEEVKQGHIIYKTMIEKVVALKERAIVHQDYLNDFVSIRDHLFLQEQRAIDELENINIVLLEIKSEIKNKHLPMINESYKDYIQDSYDKAAQIQAYRQNRPIELDELSKRVDSARDVIYKLYDNVHNLIVTAEMVEEAIVFGNRYRSTFLEVNTELTKAEVLFRNGEYTQALSTAVDIIEKIKPGSYEELIKKSLEKSI